MTCYWCAFMSAFKSSPFSWCSFSDDKERDKSSQFIISRVLLLRDQIESTTMTKWNGDVMPAKRETTVKWLSLWKINRRGMSHFSWCLCIWMNVTRWIIWCMTLKFSIIQITDGNFLFVLLSISFIVWKDKAGNK